MSNTTTITDFAMYLVRTNRAKDATTAGKRVRSALRGNKAALAKVDKGVKSHQKGATYPPLNASATKVLADALNITNVSDIKRKPRAKSAKKVAKVPVTSDTAPVTQDATL